MNYYFCDGEESICLADKQTEKREKRQHGSTSASAADFVLVLEVCVAVDFVVEAAVAVVAVVAVVAAVVDFDLVVSAVVVLVAAGPAEECAADHHEAANKGSLE